MKKTIAILAAVVLLSSCEMISPKMKFKVIGSGSMLITYSDDGGMTQYDGGSREFEREMSDGEFYYLSAQSNSGSGCKVEAYIGNELVKQSSSSGYGVASISGTY